MELIREAFKERVPRTASGLKNFRKKLSRRVPRVRKLAIMDAPEKGAKKEAADGGPDDDEVEYEEESDSNEESKIEAGESQAIGTKEQMGQVQMSPAKSV